MAVRKVTGGFRVVKKNGSLGKRVFKTEAKAKAAQAKGRALAKKNPLPGKSKAKKPKKTGSGKVADNPNNNNGSKNKFPPGKVLDLYLLGSAGITAGMKVAAGLDPKEAAGVAVGSYTGFNPTTEEFKLRNLNAGYGPIIISKGIRKVMRAGGVPSLPTTKPKTVGDFLDNISFYGITAIEMAQIGPDDPEALNRIATRNLGGVQILSGGDSRLEIGQALAKSYGPYFIQKRIRRFLREALGITFGKM